MAPPSLPLANAEEIRLPSPHLPLGAGSAGLLSALGGISLLFYAAAAWLLPQVPVLGGDSPKVMLSASLGLWRLIEAWPNPGRGLALALTLGLALGPLAAFLLTLWLAWPKANARADQSLGGDGHAALPIVLGFAVAFWAVGVLALPQADSDVYGYLAFARVAGVYHANPYTTQPAEFPSDPVLAYIPEGWARSTTPYGPVWAFLSAGLASLTPGSVPASLIGLRLSLLAVNLANALLIAALLGRARPAWVLPGVLLYAWNPIVALKGASHNEPVMLLFVLLAFYAEARGRPWLGLALQGLSVLTKFLTAPLALINAAYLWHTPRHRRWLGVLGGVGVAAALGLVAVVVARGGWPALVRVVRLPGVAAGEPWPARVIVAGLAGAAATAWGLAHSRTRPGLWESAALILLAMLAFLPNSSFAWYLITGLGLASLAIGTPWVTGLALGLTLGYWLNNVWVSLLMPQAALPAALVPVVRWGSLALACLPACLITSKKG